MKLLVAFDDRFAPHSSASVTSCLMNNEIDTVYAIVDGLPGRTRARFAAAVEKQGAACVFLDVAERALSGVPVSGHISKMSYARLLADQLLPDDVDRVIYLDGDTIILKSLQALWKMDLEGHAIAAVEGFMQLTTEVHARRHKAKLGMSPDARYFNAGIMLLDMEAVRRKDVFRRAMAFIGENSGTLSYWDPDALNAVVNGDFLPISPIWNARWRFDGQRGRYVPNIDAGLAPHIVHFDGGRGLKPWDFSAQTHPYRHKYTQYRRRSGWPIYADLNAPMALQLLQGIKASIPQEPKDRIKRGFRTVSKPFRQESKKAK